MQISIFNISKRVSLSKFLIIGNSESRRDRLAEPLVKGTKRETSVDKKGGPLGSNQKKKIEISTILLRINNSRVVTIMKLERKIEGEGTMTGRGDGSVNKTILASVLVIVQPAVQASVSQGELEPVVQVQLQFVLGLVLEVTKLAVDSACQGEIFLKFFV